MTRQFMVYLVVGGINTLFGYCLFALFLFMDMHYSLATLLATVLGVLFNFKSIGKLVFKSHDNRLIIRFFAVYAVTFTMNVVALNLCKRVGINLYAAGLFLTIPSAVVSYFLHNRFVFKKREVVCL